METFAILFAIPASLVAAFVYSHLLTWTTDQYPLLAAFLKPPSWIVLVFVVVELLVVSASEVSHVRSSIGERIWDFVQILSGLLGTPALANVLLLRPEPISKWVVVPACGAIAIVLVVLQYTVSEQLYGIDAASY